MSPYRHQIYSGMLPGWLAGHYPIEACAIALDALAADARMKFHETAALGVDVADNEVTCADGTRLNFDFLSINTGPLPAINQLPGCVEHALPIRPIEAFVAAWPELVDRMLDCCRRFDLAILGAGAAGVELAFAAQYRAMTDGWSHVRITLVGSGALPLEGGPGRMRRQVGRLLVQRGVAWLGERRAVGLMAGQINFEQGPPQRFDACQVESPARLHQLGRARVAWPPTNRVSSACYLAKCLAPASLCRGRRGGLRRCNAQVRRVCGQSRPRAGREPEGGVRRTYTPALDASTACAVPHKHRQPKCTGFVGALVHWRRLGLEVERQDRSRLHTTL